MGTVTDDIENGDFVLDRLAEVTVLFDRADYDDLESVLNAKYGSADRVGFLTNTWGTHESIIVLRLEHFRSTLRYTSKVMGVFLDQQRLDENRARAKDL